MSSFRSSAAAMSTLLLALVGAGCSGATDQAADRAENADASASASARDPQQIGSGPAYTWDRVWKVKGVGSSDAAFDPSTGRLYATNMDTDELTVVDVASGDTVATVSLEGSPAGVAVDPAIGTAVVSQTWANQVALISTQTHEVTGTVDVGGAPFGVAIDDSTHVAYVSLYAHNKVVEVDLRSGTVARTLVTSFGPGAVLIDTGQRSLYALPGELRMPRGDLALIPVYDLAADGGADDAVDVAYQVPTTTRFPGSAALDPDAHRLFLSSSGYFEGPLSVVDTSTRREVRSRPLALSHMDADLVWHRVFALGSSGDLFVLDSEGRTILRTKLGRTAARVVVDQSSGSAYVVGHDKIWCIDPV